MQFLFLFFFNVFLDRGSKRKRRNATLEAILPRNETCAALYGELKVRFRRDFRTVTWVMITGRGGRIEAEACFLSGKRRKRALFHQ